MIILLVLKVWSKEFYFFETSISYGYEKVLKKKLIQSFFGVTKFGVNVLKDYIT